MAGEDGKFRNVRDFSIEGFNLWQDIRGTLLKVLLEFMVICVTFFVQTYVFLPTLVTVLENHRNVESYYSYE